MSDEESGYCGKFFERYGSSNTCQNKIKDITRLTKRMGRSGSDTESETGNDRYSKSSSIKREEEVMRRITKRYGK